MKGLGTTDERLELEAIGEGGVWKFAEIPIDVQAIGRFAPGWPVTAPTAV